MPNTHLNSVMTAELRQQRLARHIEHTKTGRVLVFTTRFDAPTHAEAYSLGLAWIQRALDTKDDPVWVVVRRTDVTVDLRLLAISDIAKVLGLSRQRVQQLSKQPVGFLVPFATTSRGPLYRQHHVERYKEKRGTF